jgi:hypothetical protein
MGAVGAWEARSVSDIISMGAHTEFAVVVDAAGACGELVRVRAGKRRRSLPAQCQLPAESEPLMRSTCLTLTTDSKKKREFAAPFVVLNSLVSR